MWISAEGMGGRRPQPQGGFRGSRLAESLAARTEIYPAVQSGQIMLRSAWQGGQEWPANRAAGRLSLACSRHVHARHAA